MNPIILTFADGTMFFVGLGLVLIPSILLLRFRNGRIRATLTSLSLVGLGLVAISATPGTENATLDGLHLSQRGHDAMAATLASIIQVK